MKKRCLTLAFLLLLALPPILAAQELITGKARGFVPGDRVLYAEDFSRCPVGEPPSSFDKIKGAGECVRFGDRIWIAPSTKEDYRLYKRLDLGGDEFSIEFDYLPHQDFSGALGPCLILRLLESRGSAWDKAKAPYDLKISGTYNLCLFHVEGVGEIGRVQGCAKRRLRVALQVRRRQLRVFVDGKRLISVPFRLTPKERISGFEFMFVGDTNEYGALLSGIRAATYSRAEEKPTPEKLGLRVERTPQGTRLTVPEGVLFDFDQFFLKPEAREALHLVAEMLKERPDRKALIVGYTDDRGSDEYNLRLSLQRAQSVADYLIYVEGIDKARIRIEGKGKADPIADNTTPEGRAKNRRVEITILNGRD